MKIALRSLLKSPGFTIIALVTLALGIGVNTTIFTVLNRLLFFPQPFPESNRLAQVSSTPQHWTNGAVAPGDFCDIRDQNTIFTSAALFALHNEASIAESGGLAERVTAMAASADFFATIDIPAELGRTFTRVEESRGEGAAVLSHAYWQKHFGGDPRVLGRSLRVDANRVTVIGVMPATLDDPQIWNGRVDLWYLDNLKDNRQRRDNAWTSMVARLRAGATLDQAQAEMKVIAARLARDYPQTNEHRGFSVAPYAPNYESDLSRTVEWLVMALSLTVLLIACLNLANLQLVRATRRSREYAVRLALGASRAQLMQLVLSESLLLSIAGGALGLLVAKWGNLYFATHLDSPMRLDLRVLAFALIVSTLTGVVCGAIPAWLGSRTDVNAALKRGGHGSTADRSRHLLRHGLIVAEVALVLTLLSCAGFFVLGIQRIAHRELRWRPENVLTGSLTLPYGSYGDETNIRHQVFADKFHAALRQVPGVDHAALSFGSPATNPAAALNFVIEGRTPPPGTETTATLDFVSPDFLDTYGIRLLRGRDFVETDRQGAPAVAIINQAMAERFWPGENPIGRRFTTSDRREPERYEVVGVASNIVFGSDYVGQWPRFHYYRPWAQHSFRTLTFSVHSTSDARAIGVGVRKALAGIEPDVAVTRMATAEETLKANLTGISLVSRTLAELAGLGLLLSLVGIYGVIANLTVERTQEIGVRMALGAQERDVIWLFLRSGTFLTVVGIFIGLGLSFASIHLLGQSLSMMPGNDPWMIIGTAMILIAVALVACWLPARHATKVNPVVALRAD